MEKCALCGSAQDVGLVSFIVGAGLSTEEGDQVRYGSSTKPLALVCKKCIARGGLVELDIVALECSIAILMERVSVMKAVKEAVTRVAYRPGSGPRPSGQP